MKEDKKNIIYFSIQEKIACMDISYVKKIMQLIHLEEYLDGPEYLVGIMNHHGKSIPVMDLALMLGVNRKQDYTIDTILVVCTYQDMDLCLVVDKVIGQAEVSQLQIEQLKKFSGTGEYIEGMVNLNNQLMMLIDVKEIIKKNNMILSNKFDKERS